MTKEKVDRSKPHLNISHVDRGNTTLTAAIAPLLSVTQRGTAKSSRQIDYALEEKARGITINMAHIEYQPPAGTTPTSTAPATPTASRT